MACSMPTASRPAFMRLAVVCAVSVLAPAVVSAAETDFYKGKTVQLVVSTGPGGAYDTFARLMSEHWPRHIPGNPNIIVQHMPGASGLKAAGYMYSIAAKDGLVVAATHSNIPTAPLLSPEEAKFDATKFSYIGSITKDPYVGYVWHTAPIKTYEEALTIPSVMGSSSARSAGIQYALLSNAFVGTKFKLVIGYPNSPDVKLAMEKGEIDGTFGNGWGSLRTGEPEWIRDKKIRVIIQHGFKRHRDLPDVPRMIEFVKNADDRQALELVMAIQEFAKPYFAPPGIPPERLAILRKAFDAVIKDPKFLADVARMHLEVDDPLTGQELTELVAQVNKTPLAVNKRIEAIYDDFKGVEQKK